MTKRLPLTPGAGSQPTHVETPALGSRVEPNRARPANEGEAVTEHSGLSEFDLAALPTAMRRQLIGGELPVVPAHELFDTSPPNRSLTAPKAKDTRSASPVIVANGTDEASIPPRSKRNPLIALLVVAVVLVAVAVGLLQTNHPSTSATSRAPASATTADDPPIPNPANGPVPTQTTAAAHPVPVPQRAASPNPTPPPRVSATPPPAKVPPAKPREPRTAAPAASSREQSGSFLHSIVAPENE